MWPVCLFIKNAKVTSQWPALPSRIQMAVTDLRGPQGTRNHRLAPGLGSGKPLKGVCPTEGDSMRTSVASFGDTTVPQCQGHKKGKTNGRKPPSRLILTSCWSSVPVSLRVSRRIEQRGVHWWPMCAILNSGLSSPLASWIFFISLERSFTESLFSKR